MFALLKMSKWLERSKLEKSGLSILVVGFIWMIASIITNLVKTPYRCEGGGLGSVKLVEEYLLKSFPRFLLVSFMPVFLILLGLWMIIISKNKKLKECEETGK